MGLRKTDLQCLARAKEAAVKGLQADKGEGQEGQVPKKFQKYLKRCKEFWDIPASLYPSNKLH